MSVWTTRSLLGISFWKTFSFWQEMPTNLFLVGFRGTKIFGHTHLALLWVNLHCSLVLPRAPALGHTCRILLWLFSHDLLLLSVVSTTSSSNASPGQSTVESGVFPLGSSLHVMWYKCTLLTSFSHESFNSGPSQGTKTFPSWQCFHLPRSCHCYSLSLLFLAHSTIIVWLRRQLEWEFPCVLWSHQTISFRKPMTKASNIHHMNTGWARSLLGMHLLGLPPLWKISLYLEKEETKWKICPKLWFTPVGSYPECPQRVSSQPETQTYKS